MGAKRDDERVLGLPGTGGDFIDGTDVEGHLVRSGNPALPEGGGEPVRSRNPAPDEDDVEGHRVRSGNPAGPEGEGLYRGGPTTQGEVVRRGPGDNPHGER
jgi:hypothetical protein